MITRVCLSNLANTLCLVTIFFSVINFLFPFLVLCFHFEFCVSVLGFCDSVLRFVFLFWFVILFWILRFWFEFCDFVLGFAILF